MGRLSRKGSGGRPKPSMNVTPLVDVVLVLLIIFMIVIPAIQDGVSLDIPAVRTPDEEQVDEGSEPFVLSIDSRGNLYLAANPGQLERFEEATLRAELTRLHRRQPRRRLVVRGDRAASYASVRDVYAVVQEVGFPGVSLRVNHLEDDTRVASAGE